MNAEVLSGLPQPFQLIILALAAVFIAIKVAKNYFKDQVAAAVVATPVVAPAAHPSAVPIALDGRDFRELAAAVDRLDQTIRNAGAEYDRLIDALHETTKATRATGSMPPSEEMLVLLRHLARHAGVFHNPE